MWLNDFFHNVEYKLKAHDYFPAPTQFLFDQNRFFLIFKISY